MFNQFRKNVLEGFDYLKESSNTLYQDSQERLKESLDFARKVNDGIEETPENIFQSNRKRNEELFVMDSKSRLGTKYNGFTFTQDINTPNWDEEYQEKSIFGNRPETLFEGTIKGLPESWMDTIIGKERSVEPDKIGGVAGFAYDIATEIIRAPFSLTNFISGKVGQGLNNAGDVLGVDFGFDESTNNWVKGSANYLDEVNPEAGSAFKAFFGLTGENGLESEASVERSGKEWAEVVNLALPEKLEIKDGSNQMIAIGVIGSLLDTIPGSGGAKTSIKNILRNSKNVDEVFEALRFFTKKGTDEDLYKYAEELFSKKNDSTFSLMEDLIRQDTSNSSIEFYKDVDGNIEEIFNEKNKELATRFLDSAEDTKTETDNILLDKDFQDLDSSNLIREGQVDEIADNIKRTEEVSDRLSAITDEVVSAGKLSDEESAYLKEIKAELSEVINPKILNNAEAGAQVEFAETLLKRIDEIKAGKHQTGNLVDWFDRVKLGLEEFVDVTKNIDNISREIVGTLAGKTKAIEESLKLGNIDGAVSNAIDDSIISSASGKVLNAVKRARDNDAKINPVIDRFRRAVKEMTKEGMSRGEIGNAFDNHFNKKNIKFDEATVADIDEVFSQSGTWGKKLSDFLQQYRYSNMLSNISTHLINAVSNAFENTLSRPATEMVASVLENVLGIRGTGRGNLKDEFLEYYGTALSPETLNNAFKKARKVFNEVEDFKNQDITRVRRDITLGDKNLSKAYRAPLRALEASDAFFFEVVQQAELAKMTKANGGKLTAKIAKKARQTAEDAIFRMTDINDNDGLISEFFKGSANFMNNTNSSTKGLFKLFVPFVNTLAILGKKGVRRTPLLGLLDLFKYNKGKNASHVVNDIAGVLADQAIGLGVTFSGYKFAQHAQDKYKLERKGGSSKEVRYGDAEGNNYMSIKVGDRWVDLDSLGPIALPFIMGMKFYDMEQNMDKESFGKMVDLLKTGQIVEAVGNSEEAQKFMSEWLGTAVVESTNNEFASSFYDGIKALSGDSRVTYPAYIGQTLRQFSPYSSLLGAVNKTAVDTRKTISPDKWSETLEYAFKDLIDIPTSLKEGRLSFYSEGIEQKTDPDGVPLYYGDPEASVGRRALDAINPLRPQVRNEDIADKRKYEERKNKLSSDINELDGDFSEQEERSIINAINATQNGGQITQEQADILNELPENVYQDFRKKWFKEENAELLNIYKKTQEGGQITQEQADAINSISDGLYNEIVKTYQSDIEAIDLLIIEKLQKTNTITQEDADRLNSLDENYYQYLLSKINKSEVRAQKSFDKTNRLYN